MAGFLAITGCFNEFLHTSRYGLMKFWGVISQEMADKYLIKPINRGMCGATHMTASCEHGRSELDAFLLAMVSLFSRPGAPFAPFDGPLNDGRYGSSTMTFVERYERELRERK
jgi:hypothetical protein